MEDKEFGELKEAIARKEEELRVLQEIYRSQTGRRYVGGPPLENYAVGKS